MRAAGGPVVAAMRAVPPAAVGKGDAGRGVNEEGSREGEPESEMTVRRLLASMMQRIRSLVKVEVIAADACVLCGHGPNPATGVPVHCANGTQAHLACILGAANRGQGHSEAWRKAPIVRLPALPVARN
jgi:hypothetical protein